MTDPSSSLRTSGPSSSSHVAAPRPTRADGGPHEPTQEIKKGKGKAKAEGKTKVKERKVHKSVPPRAVREWLAAPSGVEEQWTTSWVKKRSSVGSDEDETRGTPSAEDSTGMNVDYDTGPHQERGAAKRSTYTHEQDPLPHIIIEPKIPVVPETQGTNVTPVVPPFAYPEFRRPGDPGPSRSQPPFPSYTAPRQSERGGFPGVMDFPRPQRMEAAREGEGEMFSRLDILLAAAADDSGVGSRGGERYGEASTVQRRGEGMVPTNSEYSQQVLGVASSTDLQLLNMNQTQPPSSGLPFPANNPNISLTPESLGLIPSVVSGSPLDVYGMDFDMGLYHDVFGWGLGAADVQQTGEAGWALDMLDLSALNNPMEFVAGRTGAGAGLAGFVAGLEGTLEQPSRMNEARLDPELVQSGRPSGRTTRQGTATPGNGEEETPWPHVFRPAAVPLERPLSLPYAIQIPTDSSDSFFSAPQQPHISSSLHASILRLVKMCHGMSPWREPDYTHFPSTAVLSHCVGLYFIHFHPILPIIRPKAYMDDQGAYHAKPGKAGAAQTRDEAYLTLLTLTVAAIGAAYAEDRMKPLGGYLMELARRTGSYLQLSDPRSIFSIPYIQSRLLVAVGGYADGSRERYLMSEVSKGLLVTASRRLQLLRHRPARSRLARHRATDTHPSARPPLPKEVRAEWREWRDEEERLRLGWAIFIFDSQAAAFLNVPAAFSLNEIQVRLPDTEEMWNMSNASMWDEANRSRKSSTGNKGASSFGAILSNMIRQGRLQERVSEFGKWILAHSLYRLCDAANMQNILMGYIEPVHPPLSDSFARPGQRNPFILLGQLVNSWQSDVSFARPSPFFASSNALRHYSNIRFILPTYLDHVQQAAGKISVCSSKEASRQWLKDQPTESVLRLHRGNPSSCSTVRCHCGQSYGSRPEVLQLSASSPGSTIMRSGSRTTEYLERWITDGGPLKIQGMSYNMTPDNVLTDFVTRLQDSPWGLSFLYAAVLNNLRLKEEKT
ncbi:hypothetical protein QFC20_007060 [Naganishia adeliensis]|uniref:Uncharacterized protein n=1 Tax=Naganishia adeliensis TaxID=92952 RepID=A0ACC2V3Q9_9TREE|nr:hypothetical protein QFC20_007060 [Naganishia adeliensis]